MVGKVLLQLRLLSCSGLPKMRGAIVQREGSVRWQLGNTTQWSESGSERERRELDSWLREGLLRSIEEASASGQRARPRARSPDGPRVPDPVADAYTVGILRIHRHRGSTV